MVSVSFFTHCIAFIQKPHHFQGSSVFAEHGSSWIKCGTLSYLLWLYFYIPVSRWKSWIIHYCIRPVIDSDQNSDAKRDPIQWALVDRRRMLLPVLKNILMITCTPELFRFLLILKFSNPLKYNMHCSIFCVTHKKREHRKTEVRKTELWNCIIYNKHLLSFVSFQVFSCLVFFQNVSFLNKP